MKNIVLVGFMGTGKTSVGTSLAEKLGMTFVDMDDCIVDREGRSIPEVFEKDGEEYFRKVERSVAQDLSRRDGLVIGTGGGIVLNRDNIYDLEKTGEIICLSASPEVILSRVEADTNRPLLECDDKMAKITEILDQRKPLYDAISKQINTDGLSLEEVVARIINTIG